MKKLVVLLGMLLCLIEANAQTPGCLYANELYTTVTPGGKYGSSFSYGTKVTPATDACFYTASPSPSPCIICVYGVNPGGNCRSGLAPTAYNGFAASYVLVACPLDTYVPILIIMISVWVFFSRRQQTDLLLA
ncbi:MAG: hypothetical protein EOO42_11340 [Flavobacteriales bacterium]|nr:MAG: hypothetical protein EOO42_11340 [Flavobacteriales bacterium]